MKIEPPTDHAALRECLTAAYGLNIDSLTFIPEGEVSIAYRVGCADGSRYFAKLMSNSPLALSIRDNLDTYLALSDELYRRKLLTSVVAPLPTLAGQLRSEFAAMPLILFPYIAGDQLQSETDSWPDSVRDQFACDVAALHLSTPQLRSPLPTTPAFEIKCVPELEHGLAALAALGPHRRAGQRQLRDLLLPHRAALAAHLEHLQTLRRIAMNKHPTLVLCHTDIHELNMIIDEQGRAHILDWENLTLAPAEHDLQAFTDSRFADFLKAYWQAGGIRQIDLDQFAFYNYRRYLGDLRDWLLRILDENNGPAQDAHDLMGIQIYCLDKLATAEDGLARIVAAIGAARTLSGPSPREEELLRPGLYLLSAQRPALAFFVLIWYNIVTGNTAGPNMGMPGFDRE